MLLHNSGQRPTLRYVINQSGVRQWLHADRLISQSLFLNSLTALAARSAGTPGERGESCLTPPLHSGGCEIHHVSKVQHRQETRPLLLSLEDLSSCVFLVLCASRQIKLGCTSWKINLGAQIYLLV